MPQIVSDFLGHVRNTNVKFKNPVNDITFLRMV
jgi:hypothetical protein